MKEEKEIRELAIRYFEGRISRADETFLFDYIRQDTTHRSQFAGWEKEWMASGIGRELVAREWTQLQNKVRTQEAIKPMLVRPTLSLWRKVAAVAAIIILTVGGTWSVMETLSHTQQEEFFTFEAPYGEKSKMTLADGTVVWLNAGSTLKYSDRFNVRNRKVILTGEGYFEVTRKQDREFTVQTHAYDVVVKGTKFDVSAYSDDPYVTTTLLEGVVELHNDKQQIRMLPGESVRLDLASGTFTRSQVNAIQSKAWSENRIEFDNITVRELAAKLSRQYDVNIRLESGKVGDLRFRISLRNRETIGEVMTALQEIIPITVERIGKDIYIRE